MNSTTKCSSLRQTRHLPYIAEFTTDIRYVKGETNFVANALSRPSVSAIDCVSAISYKDLSADHALDNEFIRLRHSTSSTLNFRLLKTFDDVLVWCDVSTGHARPYITKKFRRKVFTPLHGLGQPSHRATKPLLNSRFVWHEMNIDIANWCRSCTGCQTAKVSRHNKPVFGKVDEPTERFNHVHVDLVGPLLYSDVMAHESLNLWTTTLPAVLLGIRLAGKETLGRSAA